MQISTLIGNSQMLDGGAMFGNAPKPMWEHWIKPDELNRIPLACNSLLIKNWNNKNILLEAGVGAFFDPKLKERYGVVEKHHVLLESLKKKIYRMKIFIMSFYHIYILIMLEEY